jgi:hypothetical protein
MGALRNILPIECYCSEKQMSAIVKEVTRHLYDSDRLSLTDFDDMIGNIRVCIGFEVYLDKVELRSVAVLDSDWDEFYEDTAVLTSRLNNIVKDYNRSQKELVSQSCDILADRLSEMY